MNSDSKIIDFQKKRDEKLAVSAKLIHRELDKYKTGPATFIEPLPQDLAEKLGVDPGDYFLTTIFAGVTCYD